MISDALEVALIHLVRTVAKTEIMPRFRHLAPSDVAAKSGPEDLVTEADLCAEAAIAARAHALLPEAVIVGEEAVETRPELLAQFGEAPLSIIIDPVDGTWNFAKGLSTFGVILAVAERGEAVFGLLYDPVLDDWVRARRGGGAFYERPDGSSRQLTFGGTPSGGLTGFVPLFNFPLATRMRLAEDVPGVRRIWSVRCSCHEYRTLALDGADFCLSSALKPWDHAAGALVVEEAGGAVGLLDGRSYRASITSGGALLSARSPAVLTELRQILSPIVTEFEPGGGTL